MNIHELKYIGYYFICYRNTDSRLTHGEGGQLYTDITLQHWLGPTGTYCHPETLRNLSPTNGHTYTIFPS